MASKLSLADTDFLCSVCHGVFNNPVVLSCSHSFCKDCLKRWWKGKRILLCPLCKKRSSTSDPPCNLALKNLCECFFLELSLEEKASARSEALCSLHSEKLKLFCLDHQQPVCVVCRDSKAHTNHRFKPIDEAAEDCKEELREHLGALQNQMKHCTRVKLNWEQTAEHIRDQTQTTESQIRETFKKLQCFLTKEEEARISALRREEEEKMGQMRLKILTLSRQIESLSDTIKATEQELQSGSVTFLQNYKAAAEKAKQRSLIDDPKLSKGALIDVSKHLGNLTYNIWNKMSGMVSYSPVVLDPNTAGCTLFVSKDLKSLRYEEVESQLPQNPERFERYSTVLGSEGFDSGTHRWDVDIGNASEWALGVIGESVSRKGDIQTGYMGMRFCNGVYRGVLTDEVIPVRKQLQRIQVYLKKENKELSFFDFDTSEHVYTFHLGLTERVVPFFNTLSTMSIIPENVKLRLQL